MHLELPVAVNSWAYGPFSSRKNECFTWPSCVKCLISLAGWKAPLLHGKRLWLFLAARAKDSSTTTPLSTEWSESQQPQLVKYLPKYQVSNKKATQAFDSCWRTRVPILFKLTMNIVRKMAKIIVIKGNSLDVLSHLECVLLRRLHFCCFHWTRRSLLKKFGWDHPKTHFDFKKWPEQKDKRLRTPLASNYDRNRLWDARQDCQPPPFGGPWACPRWSAGSGPTPNAFFKSLLRVTYAMFMLITYITCFAIYLTTQQCINFYFRGNISSFMNENNSSRFFSGHPVPYQTSRTTYV